MNDHSILSRKVPGKVVENDDPQKEGRIKVFIKPIHEGINRSNLPWALPHRGFSGGNQESDEGSIAVPQVDSWVYVTFEKGPDGEPDPNKPRYHESASFKNSTPKRFRGEQDDVHDDMKSNTIGNERDPELPTYPEIRGEKYGPVVVEYDHSGNPHYLLYVDGTRIEIYSDGDMVEHTEGEKQEVSSGKKYIKVGGSFEIEVDASYTNKVQDSWKVTVGGSDTLEMKSGTYKASVGGATLEMRNGQIFLN